MSKLSFRARALDPCKPMPIYLAEELPDLLEYSAINRAVPQMPSGMEKEEESEHHLQRAICTGLIIPTPEVFTTEQDFYDRNYPPTYKMPRQLIHMQPLGLEQDIPDYDMDSADEHWVNSQMRRLDLTPLKFEQMMDRLEKSSGQTVVTLNEAKALLKQDDEVSIAVYDYWLNKRLKMQHPLILSVKTENRSGAAANNPYLAFRRRTEKMQTRKNRKNDETSYEKMLKLRRDLSRAVTLLEMVKRREKTKREQLHLSIEVFEKRFQIRDFNGSLMSELSSSIKSSRPAFAPLYSNQYSHHSSTAQSSLISSTSSSSQQQQQQQQQHHHHHYSTSQYHHSSGIGAASSSSTAATKRDLDSGSRKEKRQYKKRKHKLQREKHFTTQNVSSPAAVESTISSEEEGLAGQHLVGSEGEDEGLYSFRRNKNCEYHKPLTKNLGNWPWESKDDNGLADPKYRFTLTSIRHPRPRCVGFARRRMGRGGRVILDRMSTNGDDLWSQLDYTIFDSKTPNKSLVGDKIGTEAAASAEDENISRDLTYISTSSDPIVKPQSFWNNYCRKARHPLDTTNNTYNNSYSSLFGLITNNNSSSSISSSISHRENNSISDLLNKKIKRELPDSTYDVYDWSNDAHSDCRVQTSVDQLDTGVVDLVRTQCINRISNRNISNNNHTNYGSDNIRTILSSSNDKNKINVIKQEHATVIKQEFETDATNSDDENVNLASLSSLLNASRTTGSLSLSSFNQKLPKSEFLHSENLDLRQLTHSNYVNFNTSTKLLRCSSLPEVLCDGNESKLAVVSAAGEDENVNRSPDNKETIYNEFLEEIQKNWLHFHPKTPPTSPAAATYSFNDTDLASVNFSEQTAITIEMQRIGSSPPSSVFSAGIDTDPMFVSSAFAYNDLTGDEQILNTATTDSSNSVIDFNFSGDNLTELNLSLGEEDNEKMLDNILEECQIDDMKALNQTSIFWNGILEDGGLLDVIDDKKTILPETSKSELLVNGCGAATPEEKDCKKSAKRKSILHKSRVGNSQFSVTNAARDEKFFRKEDTSAAGQLLEEELLATPQKLQHSLSSSSQRASSSAVASNSLSQTIGSTNQATTILTNLNSANKIFIKQELTPTTAATNQVPTNLNQSQVITLSNVKLENDIGNIGLMTNLMSDAVVTPSNSISTAHVPSLLLAKQHQHQHQQQLLQQQHHQQQHQHILVQQITQASQTQMASAGVNTSMAYTDASGALLIASTSPNKRQINGPADKNSIQTILKQKYGNRKAPQPTIQTLKHHQQQQQPQYLDDDIISVVQTNQKPHQILQSGNFMKMSSYPVVVSEINSSQQQQQQNTLSASAVAVASNHNYSLQPSAQPLTIIGHQHQQGNKIILNTSSSGGTVTGGANFTISAPIQDLQNKLHYSQIPTSNIKVNLVTSSGIQQGSLIMDAKNSEMVKSTLQQHQQQLNTAQQQQQQQHQQQRIKLEKTVNMFIDPDQKRVLCKLVNLSSLQHKNSTSQPVQVSAGTTAQLLNKGHTVQRLSNSTIVANVRTLSNQVMASSGTNNAINSIVNASGSDVVGHKPQTNNSSDSTVSSGVNLNTTNR